MEFMSVVVLEAFIEAAETSSSGDVFNTDSDYIRIQKFGFYRV